MDRKDPYLSYRFVVRIDNKEAGGFNEVTGLTLETSVETFQEGGVNSQERQLAGPTKFPSRLVLKRGLADAEDLWSWYQNVVASQIVRKDIKISLKDEAGEERWQWIFSKACPIKWTGPNFQAVSNLVAFESIELVHEGLSPDSSSGPKK